MTWTKGPMLNFMNGYFILQTTKLVNNMFRNLFHTTAFVINTIIIVVVSLELQA